MLSEQDSELISASLDGQLSPEQSQAFKQRLLKEPELNRHYQTLKANDQKLKQAFAAMDDKPLPETLNQLLQPEKSRQSSNVRYLAVAASLLAVSALSYFGLQNEAGTELNPTLTAALDSTPSMTVAQLDEQTQFIVSQSFRHKKGWFCRVYMTQDSSITSNAVACKKNQKWQLEAFEQGQWSEQEHVATSSGPATQSDVEGYQAEHMQGEPISLADEALLLTDK